MVIVDTSWRWVHTWKEAAAEFTRKAKIAKTPGLRKYYLEMASRAYVRLVEAEAAFIASKLNEPEFVN